MEIGIIHYHQIQISESSTMLKGRLQFHQELLHMELVDKELTKNPPFSHHEKIFQAVKEAKFFTPEQSGIDLNRFFMMEYQLPITLHDTHSLTKPIYKQGHSLYDQNKEVASPFYVDATTTTHTHTTEAVQCFYFSHSSIAHNAEELLQAAGTMFTHIHGGTFRYELL
ncbi:hypothetical protein ACE1TH_09035 [Shouchella sp. JSM 1781072]|uniref:hypothetical protein n=1 Tax=Bacillaceae TaxID=186817 RepID=UPI000C08A276|nr:hypothetical protein [Bacillus sp. Marseille-P3800]